VVSFISKAEKDNIMEKLIYMDNAATTSTAPEVVSAMLPFFTEYYGNPSRPNATDFKAQLSDSLPPPVKYISLLFAAPILSAIISLSSSITWRWNYYLIIFKINKDNIMEKLIYMDNAATTSTALVKCTFNSILIKHLYSTHRTFMAVSDFTFGTHFTFK